MNTVEERLTRLEAFEAIRNLKARYAALADAKYTAQYQRVEPEQLAQVAFQQAQCFTEDAVWFGGEFGGDLRGHAQLHEWFKHSPWRWATHLYSSPDLQVNGGDASASWRLWQLALREDTGEAIFLFGTTIETYRRSATGQWLIASMAFKDVQMMPAAADPCPMARRLSELAGPLPR